MATDMRKTCYYVFCLSSLTFLSMGLPTTKTPINGTIQVNNRRSAKAQISSRNVVEHLIQYGYLPERMRITYSPIYTDKEVQEGLKEYQKFMGLKVTGKSDKNTLKSMNKPRCGDKDISIKMVLTPSGQRKRRQLNKETELWYLITPKPDPTKWNHNLIYFQMEAAFNVWAGVANVAFMRGDGAKRSDILISFYAGSHGDTKPFNGKGKEIAHSIPEKKEIHFNKEEDWTWQQDGTNVFRWIHPANKGIDFVQSAVHQIGHILKLNHSKESSSVMFPTLPKSNPYTEYELNDNDIKRIQNLYGKCEPKKFDAIFDNKYKDGETYIIKGPYIYKFNNNKRSVAQSWPRSVYGIYGGSELPDEVFWNTDRFMYWFVGDKYYVFTTEQLRPSRIWNVLSDQYGVIGWQGLQEGEVDAACVIEDENNVESTYLFRKDMVYKMKDDDSVKRFQPPYQVLDWKKKISDVFPGIPDNIDTCFTWGFDGKTYFFKDSYFYILDRNNKNNSGTTYGIWQWENVCNMYQCQIGPSPVNKYKCDSWYYTKKDCQFCS